LVGRKYTELAKMYFVQGSANSEKQKSAAATRDKGHVACGGGVLPIFCNDY